MLNVERNLDELFDYTQGLIKEIQEKNKTGIKSEPTMNTVSQAPSLASFKQIREDMLQYKAWQKKQAGLVQDQREDGNVKINVLEQQWKTQKSEIMMTPSSSFIMQSKPTRQSMLVEPRTPLKMTKSSILLNSLVFNNGQDFQERCLTEAQALPYDDYEAHGGEIEQQQQTNIWKIDRQFAKRSQSVQRQRSSVNKENLPRKSVYNEKENNILDDMLKDSTDKSISPRLKPSRCMSDAKNWKTRTSDSSKTMHKKTPNLDEVKRFLQKSFGEAKKPMNILDKALKQRAGNELNIHLVQGRSQSEKTHNLTTFIPYRSFHEELSEIEQREKFEMDIDMSESMVKAFTKRSSALNDPHQQTWGLEDVLREEFEQSLKALRHNANGTVYDQAKGNPLASLELNRGYTNHLLNNRNHLVQAKIPVKTVNIDCKGVDVKNSAPVDTGSAIKCPPRASQSGSKWKNSMSHQKENSDSKNNMNTSVYNQILGRSQTEKKNAIELSQKKPVKNMGRSMSINRSQSRGRIETKTEDMNINVNRSASKSKLQPATKNEGDRLYQEILEKLNKEKNPKMSQM